jgi:pimeloyl-ACP methyl ester carboxylesterase
MRVQKKKSTPSSRGAFAPRTPRGRSSGLALTVRPAADPDAPSPTLPIASGGDLRPILIPAVRLDCLRLRWHEVCTCGDHPSRAYCRPGRSTSKQPTARVSALAEPVRHERISSWCRWVAGVGRPPTDADVRSATSPLARPRLAMLKAFDGGRLFGAPFGTDGAPWVLALHGWARSHQDWRAVLGAQAATAGAPRPSQGPSGSSTAQPGALGAVALDLPGFGATPPPPEAWGSDDYAAAITPVLAELPAPAVVVGHSFGGRVAVHLAAAQPGLVRALVLTGVPLLRAAAGSRRPALSYRVGRSLHRFGLIGESRMEWLRQRYGSPDYRAATGVMREVLVRTVNETYEDQLRAVTCPVELVWADDDTEAPLSVAEAAAALLARPHLTICRGAGHFVPLTAPEALRQAIERHRP